ncbi:glutamyl-tRNA reductase [Microbacterium sp. JZ31]|uniref:glutamyl-tRNA reductase n=1 Tax=Microbacterium sp. JZ31 TaxID=1906274 RepID=UPI001933C4B9|nr:glutamyl-tRNA reductase [Microbacterium sp. JZ31]
MLLCVTASHKTATFDVLEQLSAPGADRIAPLIAPEVDGVVVLSTCNRVEAYVETDSADSAEVIADAMRSASGLSAEQFAGAYAVKTDAKAAEHLFAVASGLESVVIGEGEIGGQVRRALTDARHQGTTTSDLERMFQRATETQKAIKNATALGRAGRSLVRLALELTDSRLADWTTQKVLLIGTGMYAAATIAALRDRGVTDITVHSGSGRGKMFGEKYGIAHVTRTDVIETANASDIVITCTTSDDPVVKPPMVAGREKPLFVIDLGMPRNVDPAVGEVPGVTLLDLETIRLHAPLEELQATEAARAMVQDAAARFADVRRSRSAQPAIVALRQHAFTLLEDEIARHPESEAALRHLVGRLLHTPTVRANDYAMQGRADEVFAAIETLFGVDARPADTTAEPAPAAPTASCPVVDIASS